MPDKPIGRHTAARSYGWHEGIEHGEFSMYRACEWRQIRGTQVSKQSARV